MDYTYYLEPLAEINKLSTTQSIYINSNYQNILYVLCYHVTDTAKYPFLQFMMEKIPYCNNFIKEQFMLPFIILNDNITNIQESILNKVSNSLKSINCNVENMNNEMYKGIFYDNLKRPYAVVNITEIDIMGLNLSRNTLTWFVLPSEIINTKQVCNIDIDDTVTELFENNPELSLLKNPSNNCSYNIPDVAYTGGEYKNVEFNSVFGNRKSKTYESCGEHFYFYKSFGEAVRDGGWTQQGGTSLIDISNKNNTHSVSGRLLTDNDYGRFIHGGINRHALFIEGKTYIETEKEFSLSDIIITTIFTEPTMLICYSNSHEIKPDILVKSYENFSPLSYHSLDKSFLDDRYISEHKDKYMIL